DRLRQAGRRGAAGNDREQIVPAAAHPAGMALDQLPHRYAHHLFDIAGLLDMAGDAEDLGSGVARPAEAGEPGGTALQDGRRGGDGLDIVDGGRAAIEADSRREGRLEARLTFFAFEAFEQPGFLAADVGAGAAVQVDVVIVARAAGILADQAGRVSLFDRGLHMLRLVVELAPDIDVAGARPHADASQQAAFEQFVRVVAQDVAVLAGSRFALIGVDDEIGRPVALLRHERPFEPGRKTRAAAAAQSRFLDLVDDPVAAFEDHLPCAVPIAAATGAG